MITLIISLAIAGLSLFAVGDMLLTYWKARGRQE